jgi:hypothetical protein
MSSKTQLNIKEKSIKKTCHYVSIDEDEICIYNLERDKDCENCYEYY